MKDGFIKVAAGTPDVQVADCEFNADKIIEMVHEMEEQGAQDIPVETCFGRKLFWKKPEHSFSVLQKRPKR